MSRVAQQQRLIETRLNGPHDPAALLPQPNWSLLLPGLTTGGGDDEGSQIILGSDDQGGGGAAPAAAVPLFVAPPPRALPLPAASDANLTASKKRLAALSELTDLGVVSATEGGCIRCDISPHISLLP